jgi:hypothetical protein
LAETDQPATNEPKGDRVGNDYREGPNPNPGGEIDTGDSLVPPYEGRSTGFGDTEDMARRAESVKEMLTGRDAPEEPVQPESSADTYGTGEMAPDDVGESVGRRGENASQGTGKEPGRQDAGPQGDTGRPAGTSTARDGTGVDPQD